MCGINGRLNIFGRPIKKFNWCFYPWFNHDNKNLLNKLEEKIAKCP